MKTYNKITKMALMLGVTAWTLTSCQDWLTIYPTNQVVEENFWEDKNDLEGVRYAIYQRMCRTVEKMALWGDLRSDSYSQNVDDGDKDAYNLYQDIRLGRIERDSANTYFDWGGFYGTINYCNKVLKHGPEVLENDKQFTPSEWSQMKAEITALRALNYFYLIRAFKDIPYTTKVINSDKEVEYVDAMNQLIVLDSLIVDVESVKGQARNRFGTQEDTKGLITNPAIYAMLSDMYLWRASLHQGRWGINSSDTFTITNVPSKVGTIEIHSVKGDYQKCIDYADLAMEALVRQNNRNGMSFDRAEMLTYGLDNVYLYKNRFDNFIGGTEPLLYAFTYIFRGTSDETIFELPFSTSEQREHNLNGGSTSGGIWGYATRTHLAASDGTLSAIYNSNADDRDRDSRLWFSGWKNIIGSTQALSAPFCFKWSGGSIDMQMPSNNECKGLKVSLPSSSECNWPIYRLSDVMLQKAEAKAILENKAGGEGEAMRYVNALHRRWYCNDDKKNPVQPSESVMDADGCKYRDDKNSNTMGNAPKPSGTHVGLIDEIAVLTERQLEFLGEGKRWFDLVRYAERYAGGQNGTKDAREWKDNNPIGNGYEGVKAMVTDLMSGEYSKQKGTELINHIKNRYGLYNLIYYKEIQASKGHIEQNPVWNKSLYD